MVFPHCKCDARKVGHVIVSISHSHIRLKACSEEGALEEQEHTFPWEIVEEHEADVEEEAFTFRYTREGKPPRWVRVYSKYVSHPQSCAVTQLQVAGQIQVKVMTLSLFCMCVIFQPISWFSYAFCNVTSNLQSSVIRSAW